jgi:hypothetical protein
MNQAERCAYVTIYGVCGHPESDHAWNTTHAFLAPTRASRPSSPEPTIHDAIGALEVEMATLKRAGFEQKASGTFRAIMILKEMLSGEHSYIRSLASLTPSMEKK